ncbi:MAG: hypothetical protein KC466_15815, partial [Myxococcales bacterium]|nr:hypothetical protein [Myxococcales bacterium]
RRLDAERAECEDRVAAVRRELESSRAQAAGQPTEAAIQAKDAEIARILREARAAVAHEREACEARVAALPSPSEAPTERTLTTDAAACEAKLVAVRRQLDDAKARAESPRATSDSAAAAKLAEERARYASERAKFEKQIARLQDEALRLRRNPSGSREERELAQREAELAVVKARRAEDRDLARRVEELERERERVRKDLAAECAELILADRKARISGEDEHSGPKPDLIIRRRPL